MRISDWSSDVCSSDLQPQPDQRDSAGQQQQPAEPTAPKAGVDVVDPVDQLARRRLLAGDIGREQGAVIAVEIILGGSVGTDAAVAVEVDGDDAAAVRETELAQRSSPDIGAPTRDATVEGGRRQDRRSGPPRGG